MEKLTTIFIFFSRFFHDAIPMVGNSASVGLIKDMVVKGRLSGAEAETWVASLAFVQTPTEDMISHAKVGTHNIVTRCINQ